MNDKNPGLTDIIGNGICDMFLIWKFIVPVKRRETGWINSASLFLYSGGIA
jgi:hypothetical protein